MGAMLNGRCDYVCSERYFNIRPGPIVSVDDGLCVADYVLRYLRYGLDHGLSAAKLVESGVNEVSRTFQLRDISVYNSSVKSKSP